MSDIDWKAVASGKKVSADSADEATPKPVGKDIYDKQIDCLMNDDIDGFLALFPGHLRYGGLVRRGVVAGESLFYAAWGTTNQPMYGLFATLPYSGHCASTIDRSGGANALVGKDIDLYNKIHESPDSIDDLQNPTRNEMPTRSKLNEFARRQRLFYKNPPRD